MNLQYFKHENRNMKKTNKTRIAVFEKKQKDIPLSHYSFMNSYIISL